MSRSGDPRPTEFVVGGRRAVGEAIRAGRARRVLIIDRSRGSEGLRALLREAEVAGVPLFRVEGPKLDALGVRDHQGVAAFVRPPRELDERALGMLPLEPDALVVVLDGIMDPQNFGACGRSAEAAAASVLITRERRSAPLTPAAVRASAGALLHLPVARVANLTRAIERLKERGVSVIGLDHRAEATIHDGSPPPRPLALVVGAEDVGLSRLVRESCDLLVSIPMPGRTASLNASAALSVALFGYALRPG